MMTIQRLASTVAERLQAKPDGFDYVELIPELQRLAREEPAQVLMYLAAVQSGLFTLSSAVDEVLVNCQRPRRPFTKSPEVARFERIEAEIEARLANGARVQFRKKVRR